ncbi:MAG TPA: prepilin peptidase [Clostridiales bacterium]|nr:prepilin peptidase [Clostridiales bacterium]
METLLWLYIYFVIFVVGLCVGSFMNVQIYRLPRGIGTVKGRSFCPDCGHTLHARDLVPLFSYIFLGGRCRYCRAPISPRYAAVELLNALLWVAYAYKFMLHPLTMVAHFVFGSSLLCIIFIDAAHMLIFDRFNVAIALSGVMIAVDKFLCGNAGHHHHHHHLFPQDVTIVDRLIGALCVSGLFLLIAIVSRGRWIGEGDIKLTAAAGLVLGWKNMLGVLFLASLAGSVISLVLLGIAKRRKPARVGGDNDGAGDAASPKEAGGGQEYAADEEAPAGHAVPFGPYLAGAMIVMSFFGAEIIDFYLKLCGF